MLGLFPDFGIIKLWIEGDYIDYPIHLLTMLITNQVRILCQSTIKAIM